MRTMSTVQPSYRLLGAVLLAATTAAAAGMERFDLAQIADGESREFTAADRTLTAARKGEVVHIQMKGGGEDRTFECNIGKDKCIVMTSTGDEGKQMRMMFMRHADGETTADHEVVMEKLCPKGEDCTGRRVVFVEKKDGDDGTEVVEKRVHVFSGDGDVEWVDDGSGEVAMVGGEHLMIQGDGAGFSFTTEGGPNGHNVVIVGADPSKVMLRCPEGDVHMTVAKDEAELRYECPKHGKALEKAAQPKVQRARVAPPKN